LKKRFAKKLKNFACILDTLRQVYNLAKVREVEQEFLGTLNFEKNKDDRKTSTCKLYN